MIGAIARALKKKGIEPDTIDIRAEIDRTLSPRENFGIILGKYGSLGNRNISQPTKSVNKMDNFFQAERIHSNRSPKAKRMDDRLKARKVFEIHELNGSNFKKWKKSPNRYDIRNIDRF